jgi:hypothetical protein
MYYNVIYKEYLNKKKRIENKNPIKKKVAVKKVAVKKLIIKKPIIKKAFVKKPIIKKPIIKKPIVKKLIIKKAFVKKPILKKPNIKKLALKKPDVNEKKMRLENIIRDINIMKKNIENRNLENIPFLKRQITADDIIIYDKVIENDRGGYNLGDLLNMPALLGLWDYTNPHGKGRMNSLGKIYEYTILSYYCENRKDKDPIPDVKLINESVKNFTEHNRYLYEDILAVVKDTSTCCVHVRNGDCETEQYYINLIIELSDIFDTIILLSGVHSDEGFKKHDDKINNFVNTINSILNKKTNIYIYLNCADIHLSIMMNAANLLLHKGGYSCLGSIVSTGILFITDIFHVVNCKLWKQLVNKPYTKL